MRPGCPASSRYDTTVESAAHSTGLVHVRRRFANHAKANRLDEHEQHSCLVAFEDALRIAGNKERIEECATRSDRRLEANRAVRLSAPEECEGCRRAGAATPRAAPASKHRPTAIDLSDNGIVTGRSGSRRRVMTLAGVHGNRTHPTRRRQVANGFEDRESHQAPSTPSRRHASTRPRSCFSRTSPISTASGTSERYSAT